MSNEFISTNPYRFTGKEKTFLHPGEYFTSSQLLFSPDGAWRLLLWKDKLFIARLDPDKPNLFVTPWQAKFEHSDTCFAIMQQDGNFCVYQGTDPQHQGKLLWQANVNSGRCAVMQWDGNFCLYNYDRPQYSPGCIVWQAGFNIGLVDHYEFTEINYDYDHITYLAPTIETAFSQIIKNNSSQEQRTEVVFQIKTIEKHSWQTESSSKLGIKSSVRIDIPLGVKIGFEISGEFTESSAEGKESTTEKTTTYSVPVVVPPHKAMKVDACITNSAIKLPYTSKGHFMLKDNCASYCELTGTFVAQAGTELNVYYQEMDLPNTTEEQKAGITEGNKQLIDAPTYQAIGEPTRMDKSIIQTI